MSSSKINRLRDYEAHKARSFIGSHLYTYMCEHVCVFVINENRVKQKQLSGLAVFKIFKYKHLLFFCAKCILRF